MENIKTKSVTLDFYKEEKKFITKTIPFSSICSLSLDNIEYNIGHTEDGDFLEFFIALSTDLRIYKDKIDDSLLDIINKYSICNITLNLSDNTTRSYNVIWNPNKDNKNDVEFISEEDGVLLITIA